MAGRGVEPRGQELEHYPYGWFYGGNKTMGPFTTDSPARGVETSRETRPDKLADAEDWDFKEFSSYFHDQLELMLSMDESLE